MSALVSGLDGWLVLDQHIEMACHLRDVRTALARAAHIKFSGLVRHDERLVGHLDGLVMAGSSVRRCIPLLDVLNPGAVFTRMVVALQAGDAVQVQRLFDLVASISETERGLLSAFGWTSAQTLQGTIRTLLTSSNAAHQSVALAACAMHRVDPGDALVTALDAPDERLRNRALRVASEVGRVDLLEKMLADCHAENEVLRFWAARSALLLGDRSGTAMATLTNFAEGTQVHSDAAAEMLLKALDLPTAHQHLRHCAAQTKADTPAAAQARRRLIRRCGITGDPHLIPWLIAQMTDLRLTRLAGEAFSMITGADLAWLDLDRKPPAGIDFGPNDDPEDDNVAMDEDDGLPWPDPDKVQAWWQTQQHRFPAGQRFFVGASPSPAHALKVLRDGYQRQRIAAAQWACLLTPGTKLFPTAAPAWRQQRWLAEMG